MQDPDHHPFWLTLPGMNYPFASQALIPTSSGPKPFSGKGSHALRVLLCGDAGRLSDPEGPLGGKLDGVGTHPRLYMNRTPIWDHRISSLGLVVANLCSDRNQLVPDVDQQALMYDLMEDAELRFGPRRHPDGDC